MERLEKVMNFFWNAVGWLFFAMLLIAITCPTLYAWGNTKEVSLSFFITSTFLTAFFYTIFPYLFGKLFFEKMRQ